MVSFSSTRKPFRPCPQKFQDIHPKKILHAHSPKCNPKTYPKSKKANWNATSETTPRCSRHGWFASTTSTRDGEPCLFACYLACVRCSARVWSVWSLCAWQQFGWKQKVALHCHVSALARCGGMGDFLSLCMVSAMLRWRHGGSWEFLCYTVFCFIRLGSWCLMRLVLPHSEVSNSAPVRARPQCGESNYCWRRLVGKHHRFFAKEPYRRGEEPAKGHLRSRQEPCNCAAGLADRPRWPAELGGAADRDAEGVERHSWPYQEETLVSLTKRSRSSTSQSSQSEQEASEVLCHRCLAFRLLHYHARTTWEHPIENGRQRDVPADWHQQCDMPADLSLVRQCDVPADLRRSFGSDTPQQP